MGPTPFSKSQIGLFLRLKKWGQELFWACEIDWLEVFFPTHKLPKIWPGKFWTVPKIWQNIQLTPSLQARSKLWDAPVHCHNFGHEKRKFAKSFAKLFDPESISHQICLYCSALALSQFPSDPAAKYQPNFYQILYGPLTFVSPIKIW